MDFERRKRMGQLFEEYGGSLLAFITGAFINLVSVRSYLLRKFGLRSELA